MYAFLDLKSSRIRKFIYEFLETEGIAQREVWIHPKSNDVLCFFPFLNYPHFSISLVNSETNGHPEFANKGQ